MAKQAYPPRIYVLAGTNGAGKSSIGGATFRKRGAEYFNPDEAARQILSANPFISREEANSAAWSEGKRLLERAIGERRDFAFETTLGGRTICALLRKALAAGIEVRVWYVGLESLELHIARVRARVKNGGHDIPEAKIRERYVASRWNLMELLPKLSELLVFDNSEEGDPQAGSTPKPKLILHTKSGKIVALCEAKRAPNWAKPILMAALNASAMK
ncbi:MAG TPA: zeta toxin family protein [Candidatus Acidoferrales bacterium]|nr:zeta toxin family protein [Candidatus Acidoferrales bacterium]